MDETHMTIGKMCETFGVSARTLRFYETKKLLFPIRQGQNACSPEETAQG